MVEVHQVAVQPVVVLEKHFPAAAGALHILRVGAVEELVAPIVDVHEETHEFGVTNGCILEIEMRVGQLPQPSGAFGGSSGCIGGDGVFGGSLLSLHRRQLLTEGQGDAV